MCSVAVFPDLVQFCLVKRPQTGGQMVLSYHKVGNRKKTPKEIANPQVCFLNSKNLM